VGLLILSVWCIHAARLQADIGALPHVAQLPRRGAVVGGSEGHHVPLPSEV
jgi:hypothetical protein